jgi:hypothetical protein
LLAPTFVYTRPYSSHNANFQPPAKSFPPTCPQPGTAISTHTPPQSTFYFAHPLQNTKESCCVYSITSRWNPPLVLATVSPGRQWFHFLHFKLTRALLQLLFQTNTQLKLFQTLSFLSVHLTAYQTLLNNPRSKRCSHWFALHSCEVSEI